MLLCVAPCSICVTLPGDEKTMEAVSRIIAACSGPMACGGKVSSFTYDGVTVHIREGALGDGLGAKVWSVCHIMCRELVRHPEIFRGQQVLELGSGTGLVGLVAAAAGAQQVVMTDYEDQVVDNLRTCMHMNTAAAAAAAAASQQQQQASSAAEGTQSHALDDLFGGSTDEDEQQQQQQQSGAAVPDDAELFDDADSVEDLDLSAMLGRSSSGTATAAASSSRSPADAAAAAAAGLTAWEADNMAVRLLDWQESADALEAAEQSRSPPPAADMPEQQQASSSSSQPDRAPCVPLQQQFPVILANEVMYETAHAQLVAAAIRHRLAHGGRALLCCAVRDQAVFDMFRDSCRRWGLRYRVLRVAPNAEDLGGIRGRERDYEGGFLLMAVDHADAPAADWHRDDFEPVA